MDANVYAHINAGVAFHVHAVVDGASTVDADDDADVEVNVDDATYLLADADLGGDIEAFAVANI